MIDDELIKIWHSSPDFERIKFEKSRLMIDVQSSLDRFHKAIKYRDLREIIAAFIVIPVFSYYAYIIPYTLTKLASVLVVIWAIYLVIRLQNAKKYKPSSYTESYLEYLRKTRKYLTVQKKLLYSVLYWYIIPSGSCTILFFLGFISIPEKFTIIVTGIIGAVFIGIAIYFLNKRAVKKQLIPRLEKINELIEGMEA